MDSQTAGDTHPVATHFEVLAVFIGSPCAASDAVSRLNNEDSQTSPLGEVPRCYQPSPSCSYDDHIVFIADCLSAMYYCSRL